VIEDLKKKTEKKHLEIKPIREGGGVREKEKKSEGRGGRRWKLLFKETEKYSVYLLGVLNRGYEG